MNVVELVRSGPGLELQQLITEYKGAESKDECGFNFHVISVALIPVALQRKLTTEKVTIY